MTTLAFVDTETTGLDPFLHDPWEIAILLRTDGKPGEEQVFRVEPDLANADPKALEINRYHERTSADGWRWQDRAAVTGVVWSMLRDTVLVGSNPSFDAAMIGKLSGRLGFDVAPWHYRTVDIATLAAGYLWAVEPELMAKDPGPISSRWVSRQMGVEPPGPDAAHTALGDARWARDVYDAVTGAGVAW